MKYDYNNIDTLEDLVGILLQEIEERKEDIGFVNIAEHYLESIREELAIDNENAEICNEIIEEVIDFLNTYKPTLTCVGINGEDNICNITLIGVQGYLIHNYTLQANTEKLKDYSIAYMLSTKVRTLYYSMEELPTETDIMDIIREIMEE